MSLSGQQHSTTGRLSLAQGQRVLVVCLLLLPQLALPLWFIGPSVHHRMIVVRGGGGMRSGGPSGGRQTREGVLNVKGILVPVIPERILSELETSVTTFGPRWCRWRRTGRRRTAVAAARVVVEVVVVVVVVAVIVGCGSGMPWNAVVVVVDAGELRRISRWLRLIKGKEQSLNVSLRWTARGCCSVAPRKQKC
jgi:hypothetical protein